MSMPGMLLNNPALGSGGNLYYTSSAIAVTPSLGTEILTDPGLEATYTAGKCDTLSVAGSPTVAESADSHGGSKAQQAVATVINSRVYRQITLAAGFYAVSQWSKRAAGTGGTAKFRVGPAAGDTYVDAAITAASYAQLGGSLFTAGNTNIYLMYETGAASFDTVLGDDQSAKLISNAVQVFQHTQAYGDYTVSVTLDTGYQAGVDFLRSDASNFCRLYLGGNGKAYLLKVAAGTWTAINGWAVTYVAGASLTARVHLDGTIDVIYNGSPLATGITATGLAGTQGGPFLTDAAHVSIGAYTWDARTAT